MVLLLTPEHINGCEKENTSGRATLFRVHHKAAIQLAIGRFCNIKEGEKGRMWINERKDFGYFCALVGPGRKKHAVCMNVGSPCNT
jgi:hypothetical protein